MNFVSVEKMSKKARKEYYSRKRGEAIPTAKVGKTVHEYKERKRKLKEEW